MTLLLNVQKTYFKTKKKQKNTFYNKLVFLNKQIIMGQNYRLPSIDNS
jgi:hypothetical protein